MIIAEVSDTEWSPPLALPSDLQFAGIHSLLHLFLFPEKKTKEPKFLWEFVKGSRGVSCAMMHSLQTSFFLSASGVGLGQVVPEY